MDDNLTEAVLAIRPGRPWPTQTHAWPTQTKFCPRTPLLLAYPKFAWPFDWPAQMKIPRTAPGEKLSLLKLTIIPNVTIQPVFESVYRASIDDVYW